MAEKPRTKRKACRRSDAAQRQANTRQQAIKGTGGPIHDFRHDATNEGGEK